MASSRKVAPEERLRALLGPLLTDSPCVAVAYSGGLDSSVLLHLCVRLGVDLRAVHVHHGLSPNADAWASHCQRQCEALGVPLEVIRVEVSPRGQGIEAAAREARYRAFEGLDTDILLLAHHRDDQAETVLLQALRGGGLRGLAAMPQAARLGGIHLLRPLLECTRAELASWARDQGLVWIEDESNADIAFARNRLRHGLLPELERHAPGASAALAIRARQFAEWADLMDNLADLDLADARMDAGLSLERLGQLSRPRAANLLRRFLELQGVPPKQHALLEALPQLTTAVPEASPRVDLGEWTLVRQGGCAQIIPRVLSGGAGWQGQLWRGEEVVCLSPAGRLVFKSAIGEGVRIAPGIARIQPRYGGERLRPRPGGPRRTLKNLLREAATPAWLRPHLPLVWMGDAVAWAAGVGADSDAMVGPGEPGWLISWEPSPEFPLPR